MATLLILDGQGRRRVSLELAAQDAGHKTLAAGTIGEARRVLYTYVPEAVLLVSDLQDGDADSAVRSIRESQRRMVREVPIVSPLEVRQEGVVRAASARAGDLLGAVATALGEPA